MDDKDDEEADRQRMRDAALKVIGQRFGHVDKGRAPELTPRWQTLIDDNMVEAYRASFRRGRRPRTSIDTTDSDFVSNQRPLSMLDIPYGMTRLQNDNESRPSESFTPPKEESGNRGDYPYQHRQFDELQENPSLIPKYGRIWRQMIGARKNQYSLDSATGGIEDIPREAVALARFQARTDHDVEKPPPDTFEMIPYPDYPEGDEDETAETSLNNQTTLQIRRRSFSMATAEPEISPPDYKDVVDLKDIELETIERGNVERQESEDYECTRLGPLNSIATRAARVFCQKRTKTRLLCLVICLIGILGLIVFLGVFPKSFVYVEYYEVALKRDTFTGIVDRDTTYYSGCYVLGPTTEFVRYPSTAHFISRTDEIFSVDKLIITLDYSLQYFIRPGELGQLHKDYEKDYESVIESIARSSLKNEAGQFSVDEYRLNRPRLEKHFHDTLIKYLQGTCCQSCCPNNCKNSTVCATCDSSSSCGQAYHVDITYFQMGKVSIPDDVFERFQQQVLLQVAAEKEYFIQEKQVTVIETQRMTKNLTNQAAEIIQNATAGASKIGVMATADRESKLTAAYVQAINHSCRSLNITKEENKLSFFMQRVLEDANVKDHLYRGYNFGKNILLTN